MEERVKKLAALHYLELALGVDDKWFAFRLSDDGQDLLAVLEGAENHANT